MSFFRVGYKGEKVVVQFMNKIDDLCVVLILMECNCFIYINRIVWGI